MVPFDLGVSCLVSFCNSDSIVFLASDLEPSSIFVGNSLLGNDALDLESLPPGILVLDANSDSVVVWISNFRSGP